MKIGDKVKLEGTLPFSCFGHFAGYRIDDLKIALHTQLTTELLLTKYRIYQVEVDPEKNIIRFIDNSEFIKPPKFPGGNTSYTIAA